MLYPDCRSCHTERDRVVKTKKKTVEVEESNEEGVDNKDKEGKISTVTDPDPYVGWPVLSSLIGN